jgi:hypothetical protein
MAEISSSQSCLLPYAAIDKGLTSQMRDALGASVDAQYSRGSSIRLLAMHEQGLSILVCTAYFSAIRRSLMGLDRFQVLWR